MDYKRNIRCHSPLCFFTSLPYKSLKASLWKLRSSEQWEHVHSTALTIKKKLCQIYRISHFIIIKHPSYETYLSLAAKKKKSIYVLYLTGNKPLMPNQYWNILVPTLYSPISSSSRNLKNYRCLFVIKNMQLFSVTPYNLIFLDDFTAM